MLDIQEKRKQILLEIDELNLKRCKQCIGAQDSVPKCGCKASLDVLKKGEELLALSRSRNKHKQDRLLREFGREMTMDLYRQIKEYEIPNSEIPKRAKITQRDFAEWRREVGLLREMEGASGIPDEVFKRGKANGIPRDTIRKRVAVAGWDFERAVNTPIRPHKKHRSDIETFRKFKKIAERNGISGNTFTSRTDSGWSYERASTEPPAARHYVKAN